MENNAICQNNCAFLVLITGLSGAGKTTLAHALESFLRKKSIKAFTLDGDSIRKGVNKDLGFSPKDRAESNRRVGEISKLFIEAGMLVFAAVIAPYEKDRNIIKNIVSSKNYVEVFVNTSLETCEKRDSKGLYKKARAGELDNMTGISSPYEMPLHPDIEIVETMSVQESVALIYEVIKTRIN